MLGNLPMPARPSFAHSMLTQRTMRSLSTRNCARNIGHCFSRSFASVLERWKFCARSSRSPISVAGTGCRELAGWIDVSLRHDLHRSVVDLRPGKTVGAVSDEIGIGGKRYALGRYLKYRRALSMSVATTAERLNAAGEQLLTHNAELGDVAAAERAPQSQKDRQEKRLSLVVGQTDLTILVHCWQSEVGSRLAWLHWRPLRHRVHLCETFCHPRASRKFPENSNHAELW